MTREDVLRAKEERLHKLDNSVKNVKCPGVKKKLVRQIRALKAEMA